VIKIPFKLRSKQRESNRKYYRENRKKRIETNKELVKKRLLNDSEYKFRQNVKTAHNEYKKEIFDRFAKKCVLCSSTEESRMYHLAYVRGKKGIKYIIVVCKRCHDEIHYPLPKDDINPAYVKDLLSRQQATSKSEEAIQLESLSIKPEAEAKGNLHSSDDEKQSGKKEAE